jgi:hypothetical protein
MNTAPSDRVRWSPRRWIYTILIVVGIHLVLIMHFGEREASLGPPPGFGASIELAADVWSEKQLAEAADPTLFALPNPKSFSGDAWFTFTPIGHQVVDWTEPPRWLALNTNRLGAAFSQLVDTRKSTPLLVADMPMPPLAGVDLFLPPQPMRSKSEFRLEGDLARRALLEPIELPSLPATDLLTNSVVQLIVDASGFAYSAVLLGNSAQKEGAQREADQLALRTASNARFEPLRPSAGPKPKPESISIGKMIFEWHTIEPKVTNTASLLP